tara:strand:- start:2410 stop:5088 length:2679 start_codon:yes stop_codon:yes gene_type:complete
MPAVLTHKTIMLLAKERVKDIYTVLKTKVEGDGPGPVSTLDRQLLAIAKETLTIFTSEPRPRTEMKGLLFAGPVGEDHESYPISQYAVLGSMGPDITAFSSVLTPGNAWVFDTIHKGTPSSDREIVNAQTCDFIMQFWDQVKNGINSTITDPTERTASLQKMRAYVLGHLCHIAADVVSHPYINAYEWSGAPKPDGNQHAIVEGEIDALVARDLLQRECTLSGNDWDKWWPSENLPEPFFDAYAEALERTYTAGSNPRKGFHQFDQHLQSLGSHVAMNASFVKDGYNTLRHGVIAKGYGYGYWSVWGWLSLFFVPALALPLITAVLPHGKHIYLSDNSKHTERAWMEFVSTPLMFGTPFSIGFGALLGSVTTHGVEGRYWLGMSGSIISAVAGITMLSTLGVDDLPAGLSWPVFFVLPLIFTGLQSIIGIAEYFKDQMANMALGAIHSGPLVMLILFLLFVYIIPLLADSNENATTAFEEPRFWFGFVLWVLIMIVAWFVIPLFIKNPKIPDKPAGGLAIPRFVRLFDDTTLHHDQQLADDNIPATGFPSGYRELVKLWWTGAGDLYIRSDRYQLVFSSHEDGRNPQTISAPITPITLQDYLDFLKNNVVEPGTGTTGKLEGVIVHPEDPDYLMPAGALFADHGDTEKSAAEHDVQAQVFKQIGTTEVDTDYILFHSRKSAQSMRFSKQGPVPLERNLGSAPFIETDEGEHGWDYVHNSDTALYTDTLMSIAGDFGAILSMSAVTHMVADLKDSKDNNVNKVYQVFKNWNLDRRRLNEWRTIVSGDAINEKGPSHSGYSSEMLGEGLRPDNHTSWQEALLNGGSDQAAFDQGELTARQLGWTTVLREWMEVSRVTTQDTLATTSLKPGNPSNKALSRAMAYIFELTDPEESA